MGDFLGFFGMITLRTLFMYGFIVLLFRLMGKREIGELGIIDLAVFIMIAEMAIFSIEKYYESLIQQIYPMILLLLLQMSFSYISLKSRRFRKIIEGEASIIIKDGKLLEKEMKKQRYNYDDLMMQLRQKDIRNIGEVELALLEPTGKLSVFRKERDKKGITIALVLDGKIQKDKLQELNKSEEWLRNELKKRGYPHLSEISFAGYTNGQFFIDKNDEVPQ